MLNCKETSRLASDRLERELTLGERIGFRFHAMMCPFCRRYLQQIGWIHQMARRVARFKDGELRQLGRLDEAAKEHIRQAIKDRQKQ